MAQQNERYGTSLMALQAIRPPDLRRGGSIAHIEIPLPSVVQEQFGLWQQGERAPVLPDEAAKLMWSTPVARFLDGQDDAWTSVPGVRLLLPALATLRAVAPDLWPEDRNALISLVAESTGGISSDDLRSRLEASNFEHQLGELVLLFKYAATGTTRPLGLACDLFRLATVLVMDDSAAQGRERLFGLMGAPLLAPRLFAVPVVRRSPVATGLDERPTRPTRIDLGSSHAVVALDALARDLDEIERSSGPSSVARVKRDMSRRRASSVSTITVGGLPVVINTTEVRARLENSQRGLVKEVRDALPSGIRDRLDRHDIAVDELRIWPVLCSPPPPHRRVPSYLEPVGRTDLLLVRQTTTGYRRAEVAHVENIMVGETRNREHGSQLTTRKESFSSFTSETEETNELETTNRAELNQEVSKVVSEDLSAEGSVEVTSRGPTKVVASAGAAYAKWTEDAATMAATYARETIDRAVTRTLERTVREVRTSSERTTTETNVHGFTRAAEADDHASGIYQYLERVSRARLFWYGEREMYDLLVPEPAALLWHIATHQPDTRESPEPPDSDLFERITVANIEDHLEAAIRSFHVVDIPERPGETDIASWETSATGKGNSAKHAATGEIRIPDGYQAVSADFAVLADVELAEDDVVDPNGFLSIGGKTRVWRKPPTSSEGNVEFHATMDLVDPPDSHPLIGRSLAVGFTADNFEALTMTLTVNLELTEAARQRWRTAAYARVAGKYEQLLQEYEDAESQVDMLRPTTEQQLPAGARARLSTVVRHELQRAVITLMRNEPVDFDLVKDHPFVPSGGGLPSHPVPDAGALGIAGPEVRFLQQAFEWEHLSWILYPYFWSRRSRWEQIAVSEHVDPDFSAFLSAGAARVQLPVRPGFEGLVKHFMETGEVYREADLPRIGDAGYLPFIDEQLTALGAPTVEVPWPLDAPLEWDIVAPTPLVMLRGRSESLPTWDPVTGEEANTGEDPT